MKLARGVEVGVGPKTKPTDVEQLIGIEGSVDLKKLVGIKEPTDVKELVGTDKLVVIYHKYQH